MTDETGHLGEQADDDRLPAGVDSVFPPLLLIVLGVLLVYSALGYGETGRQLPLLVGGITVVLAVLDFVTRLPSFAGGWLRRALGAGFRDREMKHAPRLADEIVQAAWLAGCVGAIVLVGLLAAVPLFIFLYTWLRGRQPVFASALTAIAVALLTGVVFEVLLDYQLYRGLMFGGRG